MNTKSIPILITLTATFISCLASVIQRVTFSVFTKRFLLTVICFAVIGTIIRVVVERSFRVMDSEKEQKEEETEEEAEEMEEASDEEEQEN